MADLRLAPEDFEGWTSASEAVLEEAIRQVEAEASGAAPSWADLQGVPAQRARTILFRAVRRVAAVGTRDVESETETSGPFSHQVRYRASEGEVLTTQERADLRALCGVSQASGDGLPSSTFPPAADYGHLFATPRGWP